MKRIGAYGTSKCLKRLIVGAKGCFIILVFLLAFKPGVNSLAQDYPAYEEIALFLDVPDLGGRDMDVLILDNEVFLPITDLFDFLMIRNIPSPGLDTISGFFINQDATYLIDREKNQIQYGDKLYELKPGDLIRTETNLYLRSDYFGNIFGLGTEFIFRTMSVRINTRLELPAIREMRQQAIRKNMNRLIGEVEADTTIKRRYPLFHFGMADWSANVSEQLDGQVDSRLSLGLGGMLAGGEATAVLNYNSYNPITEKQQYYLWRYVNNDTRALRQVMAGKIATGATSSIYDPVVGVKITNTSTQFRRSFGTYTLSDRTEPEWIVELYVNNVLVDYTTADPSGFFTFEVPLIYGNTQVRLKFYGPWGEERTREQNITIPFNFIPKKTLEYSVSAGIVEDNRQSKFSRNVVYYGLTNGITLGTGVEYLSSVTSGELMPFVNGSFRLASNLLLSGEYAPEVRSKGTLTYRLPSSLQFDLNYVYYTRGQKAINNNFLEERKFSMSMPVRFNKLSVYNRISVNQLVLPTTNYTTAEWLISGTLFGVNTNITSYGVFIGNTKPYYYSDFSVSFRLPKDISVQPRLQYSYSNKQVLSAKVLVEKRVLKKGYLTGSYEQNYRSNTFLMEFGFRYDLKFAQTSISARHSKRSTQFIQYARGSIINDAQTNYVYTDNRGNVGRGGISIIPFLDKNANGIKEPDEPKVYGLNLRASSGRIESREKDTTIRIFGLEPYTDCFIEFDESSFDNIAWRLPIHSMNIAVDPNMMKLVEVPITIVGEAAGTVMLDHKGVSRGIARLIVNFYDKNKKIIGRTLTEQDGYFSFFGLNPGSYDVIIDSVQLRKLGMFSVPDSINIDIAAYIDGDYVDGLDFIVRYDTLKPKEEPKIIEMIVHEETEQDMDATIDSYAITMGAFENETNADSLRHQLSALLGKDVTLFPEDNLYKVRVSGFASKQEVEESFPTLQSKGISEIGLISVIGMLNPTMVSGTAGLQPDLVEPFYFTDTTVIITNLIIEEDSTSSEDTYAIEIGAIENEMEADSLRDQLSVLLGKDVTLFPEDNLYKIRVSGFASKQEVEESFPTLQSKGISEIGLISVVGTLNPALKTGKTATEAGLVEPFIFTDKSVDIAYELVEEDLTSSEDTYAIEIGAIENEMEADSLRDQLSVLSGKDVTLFPEDNLYKIRVSGFASKHEVEESFPTLQSKGISEIGLISVVGTLNPALKTGKTGIESDLSKTLTETDTTIVIIHEIIEEDPTSSIDRYAIQLGAFKRKRNADKLTSQLADILGRNADILVEGGYYKVRINGLKTSYEVKNYIPDLVKNGFREIWVVKLTGTQKQPVPSVESKPDRELIGTFTKNDTTYYVIHETIEEVLTSGTDSYAIQLGAFNVKINADVLRIKLATIMGREVKIFVENDLYKVLIPDFRTRDEVDDYIPLLMKNGVSDLKIVTLKGMQKHKVTTNRIDTIVQGSGKIVYADTTYIINKTTKSAEKPKKETTVRETPVEETNAYEHKEENTVPPEVERRKTLEERLLEAEYRSGLYEARWPGVEFTIQVAASKTIKNPEVIKSKYELSGDINVVKEDDWYRFTTGNYIKFWKAREYRNILMSRNGIEDAFIVAYKDGKRIMLTDLLAMVETMIDGSTGITVRPPMEKAFSIQVLATKDGNIPVSEIRAKYNVDDDIFKEYDAKDGLYRYSVGDFNTYTEAAKVRNKIRAAGFREAFVVGYKDGKRVEDLNSLLE
ncbi:MAG: SPOR domain-containing protein [Bacteroidales bacterium]